MSFTGRLAMTAQLGRSKQNLTQWRNEDTEEGEGEAATSASTSLSRYDNSRDSDQF